MTESFEDMFRRIVREEVDAALAARDNRIRDVVRVKPSGAPSTPVESPSGWEDLEEFQLKSGSKTYTVSVGNPVKVRGLGRGGAIGDGYTVIRIQERGGEINVDVKKGIDHTRTVKSDKIIYKRPKKEHA